jgi:hypothetical protein
MRKVSGFGFQVFGVEESKKSKSLKGPEVKETHDQKVKKTPCFQKQRARTI